MSTEAQKIKLKTPKKRSFLLEKVLPSKQSFLTYVFLSYMVLHLSKLKSWNETKVEFHHPPPCRAKCHTGDKKQGKEVCPDKRQRKGSRRSADYTISRSNLGFSVQVSDLSQTSFKLRVVV